MRKVYVDTLGEGPDLVLLHGWAMHSGIWGSVRSQLAKYFRLHLVDLPGHGVSPTPWIHGPDALKNMSEMIMDSLPEHSIICGWSLGGQIAMKLALDMPERINKLILVLLPNDKSPMKIQLFHQVCFLIIKMVLVSEGNNDKQYHQETGNNMVDHPGQHPLHSGFYLDQLCGRQPCRL